MKLQELLRKQTRHVNFILGEKFENKPYVILDLSKNNEILSKINISNTIDFEKYIQAKIKIARASFAIGKYLEDRQIYAHHNLFCKKQVRSWHLGIDLWAPNKTKIFAPLNGIIHSFANNSANGDYGPTIILEHCINGVSFYTLYGHLSLRSLNNLYIGKFIKKGSVFAEIGNYPENGNWPPHLHFQVIEDLLDKKGDFPGVSSIEEKDFYASICPNPNLLLNLPKIH